MIQINYKFDQYYQINLNRQIFESLAKTNVSNILIYNNNKCVMIGYIHSLGVTEPDLLFNFASNGPAMFYLLNGIYQPTICLNSSEWTRLRIVYVDPILDLDLFIVDEFGYDTDCQIHLLAKDGVLLNNVPRTVKSIYFTPSSRADVAIWCPFTEDKNIFRLSPDRETVIGYLQLNSDVTSRSVHVPYDLTPFTPNRPSYLQNLLNYTGVVNKFSITMDDTTVNNL